jgi:hypothetical protein
MRSAARGPGTDGSVDLCEEALDGELSRRVKPTVNALVDH